MFNFENVQELTKEQMNALSLSGNKRYTEALALELALLNFIKEATEHGLKEKFLPIKVSDLKANFSDSEKPLKKDYLNKSSVNDVIKKGFIIKVKELKEVETEKGKRTQLIEIVVQIVIND